METGDNWIIFVALNTALYAVQDQVKESSLIPINLNYINSIQLEFAVNCHCFTKRLSNNILKKTIGCGHISDLIRENTIPVTEAEILRRYALCLAHVIETVGWVVVLELSPHTWLNTTTDWMTLRIYYIMYVISSASIHRIIYKRRALLLCWYDHWHSNLLRLQHEVWVIGGTVNISYIHHFCQLHKLHTVR